MDKSNPQIRFSLGGPDNIADFYYSTYNCTDNKVDHPLSMIFDHKRDHLLIADTNNSRILILSSEDGTLVTKIPNSEGRNCDRTKMFYPTTLAIDDQADRLFVIENSQQIRAWSLKDYSLIPDILINGRFNNHGLVIDNHRQHFIIVDRHNNYMRVLSLADLSELTTIGHPEELSWELRTPIKHRTLSVLRRSLYDHGGIKIDPDSDRLIITKSYMSGVVMYSLVTNQCLFEFNGTPDKHFNSPRDSCVINKGRIIVADTDNCQLRAFTLDGVFISSFPCSIYRPQSIAFNSQRGLIAFATEYRIHVIEANQWLPDTFGDWTPQRHQYAPKTIKDVVLTITILRSFGFNCQYPTITLLANELLFQIFGFL